MSDLAKYESNLPAIGMPSDHELAAARTIATIVRESGLARGQSEATIAAKILLGRELGISPMVAVRHIWINPTSGTPETDALILAGLMRQHGYTLRQVELTNEVCTIEVTSPGDVTHPHEATYTIEEAKGAGLVRPGSQWVKGPQDMLWARAISRAARRFAPHVTLGMYVKGETGEYTEAITGEGTAPPVPTTPSSLSSIIDIASTPAEAGPVAGALSSSPAATPASAPSPGPKRGPGRPPKATPTQPKSAAPAPPPPPRPPKTGPRSPQEVVAEAEAHAGEPMPGWDAPAPKAKGPPSRAERVSSLIAKSVPIGVTEDMWVRLSGEPLERWPHDWITRAAKIRDEMIEDENTRLDGLSDEVVTLIREYRRHLVTLDMLVWYANKAPTEWAEGELTGISTMLGKLDREEATRASVFEVYLREHR